MPRSEKLAGKLVYNVARGKGFNFIYYPVDYKKTSLYLENLKGNTFEDSDKLRVRSKKLEFSTF